MKILLATYWYIPHVGGVSTYVYALGRKLEEMGHEVDILAHHPDMQRYYMANNGRVLEKCRVKDPIYEKMLRFYNQEIPQVVPWIRWREIERYSFEAAAIVFGLSRYDLIHTQDIVSTRALWRVKPRQTPLVATIHGCLATEHLISGEIKDRHSMPWSYAATEEYYGATSSDITIVPTEWLKNMLVKDFAIPGEHIKVIPYGMDIHSFLKQADQSPAWRRPPGKKILACPARLVPVKGHKYLLDALRKLKNERNDWICWLMGDGSLRQELEQQVNRLDLKDYVIFLGDRKDIPSLLNQADIVVLPSVQDNHPFSVMEAQAIGKSVVASDAGGIPEMVEHGKTGLLSPVGNVESLYRNLLRLLEDDAYRQMLGENGKLWAAVQWPLQTMMDRTLAVYRQPSVQMRKHA